MLSSLDNDLLGTINGVPKRASGTYLCNACIIKATVLFCISSMVRRF